MFEPYFFDNECVTGEPYEEMVVYVELSLLRHYLQSMIFQQGGARLHFSNSVRQYLDLKRSCRWIRKGGPISWLARSPDLTWCDIFCVATR